MNPSNFNNTKVKSKQALTKLLEQIVSEQKDPKQKKKQALFETKTKLAIRKKSLRFLSFREHSSFELSQKLIKAGFEDREVQAEINALQEQNYLNDERFCEIFIRSKKSAGFGPIKISYDLTRHQLSKALVESLINSNSKSWQELAKVVRIQKFGEREPTKWNEKAKQMRFLQSRGFDKNQINYSLKMD